MNRHTITNLEERVYLTHSGTSLSSKEPVCKSSLYGQGTRIICRIKCFGEGTESSKRISCNTHKTVNRDLESINACHYCFFNSKINCNGNFFFNISLKNSTEICRTVSQIVIPGSAYITLNKRQISSISSVAILICLSLKSSCNAVRIINIAYKRIIGNIFQCQHRKIKSKSRTNLCAQTVIVCIDLSLANKLSGKTTVVDIFPVICRKIIKCLNNKLRCRLSSIIKFSLFVFTRNLLYSRKRRNICIEHSEHIVHHIPKCKAEAFTGNLHTIRSIHQADENNLYIGIHFYNSINNSLVVKEVCSNSVSHDIEQCFNINIDSFRHNISQSSHLCLHIIVNINNNLLSLFIFKKEKTVFKIQIRGVLRICTHDTYAIRYFLYKICTKGCVTNAERNNISVRDGLLEERHQIIFFIKTTDIALIAAPTVIKLFFDAAEQIQKVVCQHAGNSKLGVIYLISLICEIFLKLQGIRALTVNANAIEKVISTILVKLIITVKAKTVSH